ncbi:aldehyde dehydrogenase family protein [Polycladidibacter stylochi]|uniref:aldehyde dehydrogenase family protein n=1 Tax=Polycladidibacter stylochi TaxID=1807766 RepID=UPI00083354FD|nr:aldehyde dehydrogenase family protein [Pseudovibrio stylochi]
MLEQAAQISDITSCMALIGGQQSFAASKEVLNLINPSTAQVFAQVPRCSASDVGKAVLAAQQAYQAGTWGSYSPTQKIACFSRFATLLSENRQELIKLEINSTGASVTSIERQLDAIDCFIRTNTATSFNAQPSTSVLAAENWQNVTRSPRGVIGVMLGSHAALTAFYLLAVNAAAKGNSVVVKPSQSSGAALLYMGKLWQDSGFPAGQLNIVTGLNEEAGAALSHHPDLDYLVSIGSKAHIVPVATAAAKSGIPCKNLVNTKTTHVCMASTNIEVFVQAVMEDLKLRPFAQTGIRLLVEREIIERVEEVIRTKLRQCVVGPPKSNADFGALKSAAHLRSLKALIREANTNKLPIIAEGAVAPGSNSNGYFHPLVALGPLPYDNPLVNDNSFSQLITLVSLEDEAQACQIVKEHSKSGQWVFWSQDLQQALTLLRCSRSQQTSVNGSFHAKDALSCYQAWRPQLDQVMTKPVVIHMGFAQKSSLY